MSTLLADMLALAVPMAIEEVRPWTPEQRIAYCHEHADIIASQSDTLQFGGKKGEPARLFAILARALACLAYQPGGVRGFMGYRWEAAPSSPNPRDPTLPAPPSGPPPRV